MTRPEARRTLCQKKPRIQLRQSTQASFLLDDVVNSGCLYAQEWLTTAGNGKRQTCFVRLKKWSDRRYRLRC